MSRVAFLRFRQSPYSRRDQRIDESISWTQFQKLLVSLIGNAYNSMPESVQAL
jgi:hypothetical protein